MWAYVALGLLWIEQPRLGGPQVLGERFIEEAQAMSGAVLMQKASYDTTCSIEALTTFDMDVSLCNVTLIADPLLILERTTDERGMWMRLVFVQNKRITRRAERHLPLERDPAPVLATMMDDMFADFGDVQIAAHKGMELFVDGKWMGALDAGRRLRLPPGQHAFEVRDKADVFYLAEWNVLARNDYETPMQLQLFSRSRSSRLSTLP